MSVPHKIKSPNLVRIGYRAPILYHPIKNCYISFFTLNLKYLITPNNIASNIYIQIKIWYLLRCYTV